MSPQEVKAAESIGALGKKIYLHDRAASVASDELKTLKDKGTSQIRSWVTEEKSGEIAVTFINDTPAAIYRAVVGADGKLARPIAVFNTPQALTPFEAGAAAARKIASAASFERCAKIYNPVVIPASNNAGLEWAAYMLPAPASGDVVPMGGAVRIETDGQRITAQRAFSRSCSSLRAGTDVAALMTSHLLDPAPVETHVFWSLWSRRPVYIAIPATGAVWEVNSDKIALIQRSGAAK